MEPIGEEKTNHKGKDIGIIVLGSRRSFTRSNNHKKDNYKAIQYEKIIPLLIESIKEQQNMIEILQGQIDENKK